MRLVVRIFVAFLILLAANDALFVFGIFPGQHTMTAMNIGFLVLMAAAFVYVLVDCRRRDVSGFPSLVYGGKAYDPGTVKKAWTWILILTFVLGLLAPLGFGASTRGADFSEVAQDPREGVEVRTFSPFPFVVQTPGLPHRGPHDL